MPFPVGLFLITETLYAWNALRFSLRDLGMRVNTPRRLHRLWSRIPNLHILHLPSACMSLCCSQQRLDRGHMRLTPVWLLLQIVNT